MKKNKIISIKKTKILSDLEKNFQTMLKFIPLNAEEEKSKEDTISVIVYLINEYFELKGESFSTDKFLLIKNLTLQIDKVIN